MDDKLNGNQEPARDAINLVQPTVNPSNIAQNPQGQTPLNPPSPINLETPISKPVSDSPTPPADPPTPSPATPPAPGNISEPLQSPAPGQPTPGSTPSFESVSVAAQETAMAMDAGENSSNMDLSPVISPPPSGKSKTGLIGTLAAVAFLTVTLFSGLALVGQKQLFQNKAFEASECDAHGGFAGFDRAADCGRMQPNGEWVNIARCNDGSTITLEPTGEAANCNTEPQCTNSDTGQTYHSGSRIFNCTGNKAACRGEAGEGIPSVCGTDGNWSDGGPECTNECPVADKSDCEYPEKCTTTDNKEGTKICSGEKDSADNNKCKWDAAVSSCSACTVNPVQSCQYNRNYQAGLLDGKVNPDSNCGTNGGVYCNDGGNFNVCCYSDGNCYQGQQRNACENLGNGSIKTNQTAQVNEYYCPDQTSAGSSCSSNIRSLGTKGPGTYSVGQDRGCGGYQIDAVGLCGSYTFKECPAPPAGGPSYTSQCLDVRFYSAAGTRITNPASEVKAGDRIKIAVSGSTNEPGGLSKARFRINSGEWEEVTTKNSQNEYFVERTIAAGAFRVEAQVYNPNLGWK
ncbi:MAG: hypothetical protein A3D24_03040 [Candidatus Blackburnbacteria bacterium RIFCSPHIGHO2_02_FULL_39_13]|uniref:Uncharacterized protein n=1 Tax=Candidatus Blackburnbacteria bacterium RIFCSPLOWO2_01_FULL_40_20 TaxID=1797519 RepID=A0A1G1VB56_9BACT|nr:MAG: hypothetical protein UT38_C0012G0013 [Microgenomates group bacterium GW2011_GWA2_39_19]OGY07458.1 MAG: hypothetical protein A2694_00350 [Candidatus Blackburnbacteria bacterium RIFCSPHIGHO2_01_FULL_40_17]OGY08458.1 MAG: hypothetical protein A3D24_03040 [Candidatus Blackburnbacteria bacterium RIFCSPHIGHO2_02_FULL_39_13]OGY12633.1 MAG: hypothetical protein A3A77_05135 [Candidatus Blackburnbacteria bacterium RIFCSPLOWO2_01_FULL_40_20]OGY14920.1 MAG: hypothetical protein A3I52_02605 [Candida